MNEKDSVSRVDVRKNALGTRSQKGQNYIASMLLLLLLFLRARVEEKSYDT